MDFISLLEVWMITEWSGPMKTFSSWTLEETCLNSHMHFLKSENVICIVFHSIQYTVHLRHTILHYKREMLQIVYETRFKRITLIGKSYSNFRIVEKWEMYVSEVMKCEPGMRNAQNRANLLWSETLNKILLMVHSGIHETNVN